MLGSVCAKPKRLRFGGGRPAEAETRPSTDIVQREDERGGLGDMGRGPRGLKRYLPAWGGARRQAVVGLGRQHIHDEDRDRVRGSRHRVFHRRQALQIGGDRRRIRLREPGVDCPGHDRRQLAPVGTFAGGEGGDDLRPRPRPEAGLLVGRQIGADEDAKPARGEADFGAAEKAPLVGVAEKTAGRMAVAAARDGHEIFAARDLRVAGVGRIMAARAMPAKAATAAAAPLRLCIGVPPFYPTIPGRAG